MNELRKLFATSPAMTKALTDGFADEIPPEHIPYIQKICAETFTEKQQRTLFQTLLECYEVSDAERKKINNVLQRKGKNKQ